tara:strand:+ start:1445 stop:1636 length:192 start_codon:yes stop_codon:yes gene_type:complete
MKCSVVDTKTGKTMGTFSNLKAAQKFQDKCIRDYERPTFAIDFIQAKGSSNKSQLKINKGKKS